MRSAETLARECLERVGEREPALHAFAHFNAEQILADARALDAAGAQSGGTAGPLFGVPVGVKDIIDTHDWPTEYGSAIYRGHRPAADAPVVALTRAAGGLVFGKTVTTEFATRPPGPTVNPHNAAHTPGGSSSGSAAAVGAGIVPLAFGTQTAGSVIRPAAYCGVVGYKPSFGTLPRVGVKAISDSFDTVGVFARTVSEAATFVSVLSGREELRRDEGITPRLAVCFTPQWDAAQAETQKLFEEVLPRIGAEHELPAAFGNLAEAHAGIWSYELPRCLADEHRRHPEKIREQLRLQIEAGWKTTFEEYDRWTGIARRCRRKLTDALGDYDALVVPSAPGEAPKGLESTGDPIFNKVWTLLHGPAVHVPLGKGPNGLPLGVQLVGRIGDDARVLACARWVERTFRNQ
jgi:Asp-tRNA(Asn)/Glu-tRNA(Gln) amidotransferase A subunit family amidase